MTTGHEARGEAYAALLADLEGALPTDLLLADLEDPRQVSTAAEWKTYRKAIDAVTTHEGETRGGADLLPFHATRGPRDATYAAPNEGETCSYRLLTFDHWDCTDPMAPRMIKGLPADYRTIDPFARRPVPTDRELWRVLSEAVQVTRATTRIEGDGWTAEYAIADPRLSDGWQVWMGSDFTSDGEPVDYRLPGRRANRGKPRHDYVSFCTYVIDRRGHQCGESHTDKRGRRGWVCKVIDPRTGLAHGKDAVRGGYVASGLDDGAPERVKGSDGVMVANTRGKYIGTGSRKTYAGRSKGKYGQAVTERPSEPVMASGKWGKYSREISKWTADDKRANTGTPLFSNLPSASVPCKAVVVYVGRVRTPDGSFKGRRLTKILVRQSREHGYGLAVSTPHGFSSIVARDARAKAVLAEQVKVAKAEKTEQSRAALILASDAVSADDDLMARTSAILARRGVGTA